MKKILLLFALPLISLTNLQAQEICNDGIDNDGNDLIDCFDGACSDDSACDGFYLGNDASCEAQPNAFPQFSLSLGYESDIRTTTMLNNTVIGDLDRDSIPEIVTSQYYDGKIFLLNGDDATIKHEADLDFPTFRGGAIANLQDDNCGEVFFTYWNGSGWAIGAYDCELNNIWNSNTLIGDPMIYSFADFDRDGVPEMYYKDEIRDPVTGTRIVASSAANNTEWRRINAGPIAVDILGDEDLELVVGDKIYAVNLGSRGADAGSLTLLQSMPTDKFNYRVKDNNRDQSAMTSIADYNLDGNLDVIISGATNGKPSSNVTAAFFWDVANDTVKAFSDPRPTENNYQAGWRNGLGRINIADLDGINGLNAAFVSGKYLYALDENWEMLWVDNIGNPDPTVVNEETSGITGCTLFDFNGDGQSEVVYRDEDFLYILNGNDGSTNTSIPCRSRTNIEYPIVADVDADGSTEICVVCADVDESPGTLGKNLNLDDDGEIRIYKSGGEPWVPARRLWNQHGYFNVNINDDLTVPRNQQKHQTVFSTGVCTTGPSRPLNSFLNQSPFLSSDGCPTYASPDLNIIESSLVITAPNCPDQDFTVSFDFENIGDVPLSRWVPITFYDGDPLVAGANKLNTDSIFLSNFTVNSVGSAVDLVVNGTGSNFTLYVSLNDDGTRTPTPITFPASNILECDYFNNIVSAEVNPVPFALTTETTNNISCASGGIGANGSARVFRLVSGVENTADYDFFWFDGPTVTATPDFTGSTYSGLSAGTYTVFATAKSAGCSSDTAQVVISDSARTVDAAITVDAGNSNCRNPNGKLTVIVNGGDPVGDFEYEWYEGNDVGGGAQISNSHVATGLSSAIYTVLITEKATGCQTIVSSIKVPDETNTPVVDAFPTNIVCSDANSGSVRAEVNGSTTGHTFEWFSGPSVKPTPDYTGDEVTGLAQGSYTVVATANGSNCKSAPVTVNVAQTTNPEIDALSSTENNSCDSSQPNGTASITIIGNPAEHTIEWYAGANTTGAIIGNGLSVDGLAAGEYTAKLINNNTGCSVNDRVTVVSNIQIPVASATPSPVTTCNPFNGSIEVAVDLDNVSDYTYSWYIGDQVEASNEIDETSSNIFNGLEPGIYTVQAFHTTRLCLADPVTVEVLDQATININQTTTEIQPATACDLDNGVLKVEVSSPGNTSGFDIEWYSGSSVSGSPFLEDEGVTESSATGLFTGLYTVVATDLNTGCSNQSILNLPFIDAHTLDLVSKQNTTTCVPFDGNIIVTLGAATSTPDEGDYSFTISKEENGSFMPLNVVSHPTVGTTGTTQYTFGELDEGSYIIEAINNESGCSVFHTEEVGRDSTDPVVNATTRVANTNCGSSNANGSLEIDIDNGTSPSLYTIEWFEGENTSTTLGTNVGSVSGSNPAIAENLLGGKYTVRVTNNSTACSTVRTYTLAENPVVISVPSAELDIVPITQCGPPNSTATINNVFENGSVADINDYDFEWYDADSTLLTSTTNSISGLEEGTYFVKAINTVRGCETTFTEFTIENEIIEPVITLEFENPQKCGIAGPGELRVNAAGAASFSYNWYNGTAASGTIVQEGPDYLGLQAGSYTVQIMDSSTNCIYIETYTLETEQVDVNISTSANGVSNCDLPNGSIFAAVTTPSNEGYSYSWTDASGNVIGRTNEIDSLPAGDYTVVATDISDSDCSATATVTVTDERLNPEITLEQIAPLTVCDLTIANGAAKASVGGEFIGYTFEWFEGNSAEGAVVYEGPEFSEMKDILYTLRVTNDLTKCISTDTISISAELPIINEPTITVVANDTHCQIDNGELSVTVDGNISNYLFNWYRGENENGTSFATGDRVTDLSAGQYTVVATDLSTGCTSPAVTAEILEELNYPVLSLEITNTTCNKSEGTASVYISGGVELDRIEWFTDRGARVGKGPNLAGVPAGSYTVVVETLNGCIAEEDLTIISEINAFNGISRNGDGANSFFKVDCISQYPNNSVKIYNRAGTLVYEATGYDNNNVRFDGVSNRGINILGADLPDGTYFYVIDKNDGSKPSNGYLEIVK